MKRGELVEVRDVAPGLWVWRTNSPYWRPGLGWENPITSVCVHTGGEVVLIDAAAPPDDARDF